MCSTLDQALAGDIVLCSWARHCTLTVPLSIQVYKWVSASLMLGVTLQWNSIMSKGGVEVLLVAFCCRFLPNLEPLVSYADLQENLLGKKVLKISKNDLKTTDIES